MIEIRSNITIPKIIALYKELNGNYPAGSVDLKLPAFPENFKIIFTSMSFTFAEAS